MEFAMDYLKAVFWEYPQYSERETLISILKEKSNVNLYLWIMRRFLEYGRVVDILGYFRIEEIAEYLQKLKLTPYTLKKWKRMIEVYGNS
jgi:hypothetical protein